MSRFLAGHGYMLDGHLPRVDAIEATRAALVAAGVDPLVADDDLVDQPGLVARAWYGGDEIGFVGVDHERAQKVTVVHVAVPE